MMVNSTRWTRLALGVVFTFWASSVLALDPGCQVQSTTRFALVIGNGYEGARAVSGPLDAEEIAKHLCQLGFSVDLLTNATLEDLKGNPSTSKQGALSAFGQRIKDVADEVVFFYSGHGYQIRGENYLLPNDQEIDFADPQLPLSDVLDSLKNAPNKAKKLVFLDACRTLENPPEDLDHAGLAETHNLPKGTLLSYAAEYNFAVPSGSNGTLSPYSAALATWIREPGLGIFPLLARVAAKVARTQTSIYQVSEFPGHTFKKAISVPLSVGGDVDDQLLVFHNGELVLAAAPEDAEGETQSKNSTTLELNGGEHRLVLVMLNNKDFKDHQTWQPTDGWNYALEVGWPPDTKTNCPDFPRCFNGSEVTPFKSGPHHGQGFEVARATIQVDPGTWVIEAEVDNEVWRKKTPPWAADQTVLWQGALGSLGLEERVSLQQLFALYRFVQDVVAALQIARVKLPDLNNFVAEVFGNEKLEPAVEFCMTDRREERLNGLEESLRLLLEDSESRPFESFDRELSNCFQEWVDDHPENALFGQEVRIWTAFEEKEIDPMKVVEPRVVRQPGSREHHR